MKTTIADLARAAGVSTATVDRVLNNRPGVHARTRSRVLAAAEGTGYIAAPLPPGRMPAELAFLIPAGTNTFFGSMSALLAELGGRRAAEVRLRVHRVAAFHPAAFAEELRRVAGTADGVGVIALDHPDLREAIRAAALLGTKILTLVSDVHDVPRIGYVGIDNRAAGRLAGHLLGRLLGPRRGEIALVAASRSYRGHEEREMGFRGIIADEFPKLTVLQLREGQDDLERSYAEIRDVLQNQPKLVGIYNIGAGNRGIARALQEAGRAGNVVFIGHELTEHTRGFLLSGTMDAVIDQNPREEAEAAVDRLLAAIRGQPVAQHAPLIRIQAIFRENIPAL